MPINPDAVGSATAPFEASWNSKDCLLYALGVGAGAADPTGAELEFTTENSEGITHHALPTMCVVIPGSAPGESPLKPLGDPNFATLLHGEQAITVHKPLPVEATVNAVTQIAEIWDKGKAAVVVLETTATDTADGQPMYTTRSKLFFRGEGGWGGDPGPRGTVAMPERSPDHVATAQTRTDQALLYRLNGDHNPLHSDPKFAAMGGFDRPILHGLCTYGTTGRLLLHHLCDGDPSRFNGMDARFSSPVMPGDQLDVHIWSEADRTMFRTVVGDRTVIDNGVLHHS